MHYPTDTKLARTYFENGMKKVQYWDISRKCTTVVHFDYEDDNQVINLDCLLIRQMIRDYVNDTSHCQYTTPAYKVEEARQLLTDCINALTEKGSTRKEFAGKPHNSPDTLHLVASLAPIALNFIGYEMMINTNRAIMHLERVLLAICDQAVTRYEKVLYNDVNQCIL